MSEMMNKKREKKRIHLSKRGKSFFKGVNRLYWLLIIGTVGFIAFLGFSVVSQYKATTKWEKNPNEVTMASQSLDLLYDKDKVSKKNKVNFAALRKTLINSDGSLTKAVNMSKIKELKGYLDKIDTKSSEVNYSKEYAEIAIKYSLLNKYSDLFQSDSDKILKENVTPLTVSKLNDESYNNLKKFYMANPNDAFVKDYSDKLAPLISDVEAFNNIVNLFDSRVTKGLNSVSLVNGYNGDLMKEFTDAKSKLNLDWQSTKYMDEVVSLLIPVNSKVNGLYAKYNKYEADQEAKQKALATWEANKAEFFEAVESIHKQAVAEKHEKERLEKLKKELDEGIKKGLETLKGLTNIKDDERNNLLDRMSKATTIEEVNFLVSRGNTLDTEAKEKADKEKEAQEKAKENATKPSQSSSKETSQSSASKD